MTIIGVRFKKAGKIYYFDAEDYHLDKGTHVIVEISRGIEYGVVELPRREIDDNYLPSPPKKIIRVATQEDIIKNESNKAYEVEALSICAEKIKKHKLDMKLVNVELTFDNNKIIFYFTSDGRVDFRELVKELASIFKMRIELRQIGVRDEAKMINGIGICGRTLCCSTFLSDFQHVSIKMAKDQNLSLNPTKISGVCGRLMCCLKYEQETYEELNKNLPKEGDTIKTPEGEGEVLSVSTLRQTVRAAVRKNKKDLPSIFVFHLDEIKIISKRFKDNNYKMDNDDLKEILD